MEWQVDFFLPFLLPFFSSIFFSTLRYMFEGAFLCMGYILTVNVECEGILWQKERET